MRGMMLWLVLGLGATRPGSAQERQAPDFRPLEFLAGSCWVGTFPDGKATDEHCFDWVFDRKFLRDRHVVHGGLQPYQGETIYGMDPVAKQLSFWYWNSDGDMMIGRVEYTPEGIVFPARYTTPKGDVEIKAVWTRAGSDAYRVVNSQRDGADWKPLWSMELRRK